MTTAVLELGNHHAVFVFAHGPFGTTVTGAKNTCENYISIVLV